MDTEKLTDLWVRHQMRQDGLIGFDKHEEIYGCTITITNVEFGTAWSGGCDTCFHEYPAVIFDAHCSCPAKIPQKKNPEKLRKNPNRVNDKNYDIAGEFKLQDIIADMIAIEKENQ